MGESGNLLQWDYQTVGYIGMGYLDVLGDCIPMVDTHVGHCYCMFSSGKTHTNWTLEGRGIVVWDCCFLLSGQVWEDIGMGYLDWDGFTELFWGRRKNSRRKKRLV
jgi:hypothetical protein